MTKITELPLMEVILKAEEKHGLTTHMVVEAVRKDDEMEELEPDEDCVVWWVEFENEKKIFERFTDVEKYLLEDAVATGEGPEVVMEESKVFEYDDVVEVQDVDVEVV